VLGVSGIGNMRIFGLQIDGTVYFDVFEPNAH
jgi:hypothetical protein